MNHEQLEISTPYFQMSLTNILYLVRRDLWSLDKTELSTDNLIHDYLILLRYYDTYTLAKNEIKKRLLVECQSRHNTSQLIYILSDILMDIIYYQMCMYGLYQRGEYDYRLVKTNTIQIRGWIDEYTPVFEFIDYTVTESNIERFQYLIF